LRLADGALRSGLRDAVRRRLGGVGLGITVVRKDIGYELRSAKPVPCDAEYTRTVGYGAVRYLLGGGSGALSALRGGRIAPVPPPSAAFPQPIPGVIAPGQPSYPYWQPALSGYVAMRSVVITTYKTQAAGTILDAVTSSGINGAGIRFGLRNQRAAHLQALALAMKDAREQAKALAFAGELRLGRIKSVRIDSGYGYVDPMMAKAAAFPNPPPPIPTQITPSQITERAAVTITYYIR